MTDTSAADDPMPRIMRDSPEAGSGDVAAENVAALKALFPTIVTDGCVDFEVLRQLLGEEVDEGEERYGLNWKGKRRARAFALTPTLATLRPAKAESKDWKTTKNIVVEGDNLEVLKCLRRSYAGQVKLLYIDPPYNTGNDFVYPDDYADSLGNYERLTGQRDKDGAVLTTNKEGSGRFHTDWLNMMYPRLMLAKELLRDDGVIFVSIGDDEVGRLETALEEIYGKEKRLGVFVRRRRVSSAMADRHTSTDHEYLIAYHGGRFHSLGEPKSFDRYQNPDNDPRGPWISDNLTVGMGRDLRPNQYYPLTDPETGVVYQPNPNRVWCYAPDTMARAIKEKRIIFPADPSRRPMVKRFRDELRSDADPVSTWLADAPLNLVANQEMQSLFPEAQFSYPKPMGLIQWLVRTSTQPDDLVLDFFAGSGTTGHAVMAQNAADGGNRRYILVQLPEPLDPSSASQKTAADFCDTLGVPRTIAELTKERLRRAGTKVAADNQDNSIDIGFRVYKLASSNLKPWQPDADNLAQSLLDAVDNVLPDRSEDDLLVELLLKTGIDLTLPMETRTIAERPVHALGGGVLIVSLSDVSDAEAESIGQGIADWHAELDPVRPTTFYFRDSGFGTAAAKANVAAIIRQRVGNRVERLASI